jgi:hypothetical protein
MVVYGRLHILLQKRKKTPPKITLSGAKRGSSGSDSGSDLTNVQ